MRLLKYKTIKGNPSLNLNLQMESVKKKFHWMLILLFFILFFFQ